MMTNIFNIFDPVTEIACTSLSSFTAPLNWLSTLIIFTLFPLPYWVLPSRSIVMWQVLLMMIFKEFKVLIKYSLSNLIMFTSLFTLILMNNFMGLFPYIFTASSHSSFSLSLSMTIWLSMIIYSLINYFNELCSHLTPQGTPSILMPFMVMIESISLIIRPVTLAVRLSANMVAGHLLLTLMGSTGSMINSTFMIVFVITSQILLYLLEISVSIIQAYVFSVLATLYSSES